MDRKQHWQIARRRTQIIEIAVISCNKHTIVCLFQVHIEQIRTPRGRLPENSWRARSAHTARKRWRRSAKRAAPHLRTWLCGNEPAAARRRGRDPGRVALQSYQHQAGTAVRPRAGPHQRTASSARSCPAGETAAGREALSLRRVPRHLPHDEEARGLHRQFRTAKPRTEELRRDREVARRIRATVDGNSRGRRIGRRIRGRRYPGGDVCDPGASYRHLHVVPAGRTTDPRGHRRRPREAGSVERYPRREGKSRPNKSRPNKSCSTSPVRKTSRSSRNVAPGQQRD